MFSACGISWHVITTYSRYVYSFILAFLVTVSASAATEEVDVKGPITFRITRMSLREFQGRQNEKEHPTPSVIIPVRPVGDRKDVDVPSPDGSVILRKTDIQTEQFRRKLYLRLLEAVSGKPLGPEIELKRGGLELAVAPDNQTIASSEFWNDTGGQITVFDGPTGKVLAKWSTGDVFHMHFSDDSKTLHVTCGRKPKS
jgi:hypothetical protein